MALSINRSIDRPTNQSAAFVVLPTVQKYPNMPISLSKNSSNVDALSARLVKELGQHPTRDFMLDELPLSIHAHKPRHRHVVRGERSRFVAADHCRAPQCLHRRQPPHDRVLLRHLPRAQCKARCHNSWKALRDGRDSQCNSDLEVVQRPRDLDKAKRLS